MTEVAGIEISTDALAEICRRYHVAELSLFGSGVRDDSSEDSDIDLLYVIERGRRIGWIEVHALQKELTHLFDRPVDLVAKNYLNRHLRDDVLSQARVLYAA